MSGSWSSFAIKATNSLKSMTERVWQSLREHDPKGRNAAKAPPSLKIIEVSDLPAIRQKQVPTRHNY